MIRKLFKPGDRVQLADGPIMIVQRYQRKYNILYGWHEDYNSVECSWYDQKKGYRRGVFLQKNLTKVVRNIRPAYQFKNNF